MKRRKKSRQDFAAALDRDTLNMNKTSKDTHKKRRRHTQVAAAHSFVHAKEKKKMK